MWDFLVRVVCERKCENSRQSEEQEVFAGSSQEAFSRSEACAYHDWSVKSQDRMVTSGFRECLVGKAFPRDTRETFYFANLSYLIH